MLRRSLLKLKAHRCLYETLGVPPSASGDEIKRAFRERAKQTHPDAKRGSSAGGDGSRGFGELVEAYRVLRDAAQRKKYDQETAKASARAQYGPSWGPRGPGPGPGPDGMGSETMRGGQPGYAAGPHPGAAAGGFASRISSGEKTAIAVVCLGALAWVANRSNPAEYRDPDPHPAKRPQALATVNSIGVAGRQQSPVAPRVVVPPDPAPASAPVVDREAPSAGKTAGVVIPAAIDRVSGPSSTMFVQEREQPVDELVRAFYNPYADKWMRIPAGYEPPAAMDLTAWHKKRTEPSEWARLFAEGKLSEIMPRGGLKVRYLPAWETYDAMIVWDPLTGRTVSVTEKLPKRIPGQRQACGVVF